MFFFKETGKLVYLQTGVMAAGPDLEMVPVTASQVLMDLYVCLWFGWDAQKNLTVYAWKQISLKKGLVYASSNNFSSLTVSIAKPVCP